MRAAGGSLLVGAGVLTLWLALAGKLDLFAQFWTALVTGAPTMGGSGPASGSGSGGGGAGGFGGGSALDVVGGDTISDATLQEYLRGLPNPPKIPPGAEWIFKP